MPKNTTLNPIPAKIFALEIPDLGALLLAAGAFFFWLNLLITKFVYFGYYDWDLAMYAQVVWALSQGSWHSSLFGTTFLTNHAEYIAFFLAPIYKLFPSAFTLIVLKILAYVTGAYVFYHIVKKALDWRMAILFMVLYLIHPANAFMLIYEFHFENLAIPFIFLMYYFFKEQKLIPFLISAFFATIVKENISLIVMMFGFYALFTKREQKAIWVIGPLILGAGFFILTMFFITPYLRAHDGITSAGQYITLYWNQSNASVPLTKTLINNFLTAWHNVSSPLNVHFIKNLLGSFNILPFLSLNILFLGAPVIFANFLSPVPQMHTLFYHYAATIIPFIFLATIETLRRLRISFRPHIFTLIFAIIILTYPINLLQQWPLWQSRTTFWKDHLDPVRWQMVDQIPKDAPVIATFDFLDKLVNRKFLYSLHTVWLNVEPFRHHLSFTLPAHTQFAIIDWESPWLWGDVESKEPKEAHAILERLRNFYLQNNWQTIQATEALTLLEKKSSAATPELSLIQIQKTAFAQSKKHMTPITRIDHQIKLIETDMDLNSLKHGQTVPMTFVWNAEEGIKDIYATALTLRSGSKIIRSWHHHIGYAIYATPLWKKGDYIRERYSLLMPPLAPGKYTLHMSVINQTTKKSVNLSQQSQSGNSIELAAFTIGREENHETKN